MNISSIQNGASHGLVFQVQPQTATNQSAQSSFSFQGGLASSASSGSLPKVSDYIKVSANSSSMNTTNSMSQGTQNNAIVGAQPANKENNTKKSIGEVIAGFFQSTSDSGSVPTSASNTRAVSGHGPSGSMQLSSLHHAKPGLMQNAGHHQPNVAGATNGNTKGGREFGREITNANTQPPNGMGSNKLMFDQNVQNTIILPQVGQTVPGKRVGEVPTSATAQNAAKMGPTKFTNQRTSTSVVVNKGSANQFPPQRRNIKNVVAIGSGSFIPSAMNSGNHSRQRSPVIGLGQDAKFFNATSNLSTGTGTLINISDKKHEILATSSTFNLSMNLIPMNGSALHVPSTSESEISKLSLSNTHIIVKEEQQEEEEEEEVKSFAKVAQEIHINVNDSVSTPITCQSTVINASNESAAEIKERCRLRMEEVKKDKKKELPLGDQLDMRNPQCIAEFAQDVYQSMIGQEEEFQIDNSYIKKIQTEIKDTSRGFLVEWIIDVHRKFRLLPETLHVTISIVDRFLSLVNIKKNQLHIIGVTAILIATKYEEIYPPELKDLLQIAENKFSKEEVLQMEFNVLTALQFNFQAPSSYRFLERYRKLSNNASDEQIFFFAQYLAEISLLDSYLYKYKQSQIAAACLILSAKAIKRINAWNAEMERWTGYKADDLKEAIEDVKQFALEVNPKFLSTLKYKFQKQEYMSVAQIAFNF